MVNILLVGWRKKNLFHKTVIDCDLNWLSIILLVYVKKATTEIEYCSGSVYVVANTIPDLKTLICESCAIVSVYIFIYFFVQSIVENNGQSVTMLFSVQIIDSMNNANFVIVNIFSFSIQSFGGLSKVATKKLYTQKHRYHKRLFIGFWFVFNHCYYTCVYCWSFELHQLFLSVDVWFFFSVL